MAMAGFTLQCFSEIDKFILRMELHCWQKESYNNLIKE
jgi:hypothetical protein